MSNKPKKHLSLISSDGTDYIFNFTIDNKICSDSLIWKKKNEVNINTYNYIKIEVGSTSIAGSDSCVCGSDSSFVVASGSCVCKMPC